MNLDDEHVRQILVESGFHDTMTELDDLAVDHIKKCPAARAIRIAYDRGLIAPHTPRRESDIAAWIKAFRDEFGDPRAAGAGNWNARAAWSALDDLLDNYRLRADTGLPLAADIADAGPHGPGEQ